MMQFVGKGEPRQYVLLDVPFLSYPPVSFLMTSTSSLL